MKSMTGFGVARGRVEDRILVAEVRSVNHRYCEVNLRFPGRYASLEPEIAKMVRRQFERGKFDLFLREETVGTGQEELHLFRRSYSLLRKIRKSLRLGGPITLSDLVTFYNVQKSRPETPEKSRTACRRLVLQALADLEKMRNREGDHLKQWFNGRLRRLQRTLASVEKGAGRAAKKIRQRNHQRNQMRRGLEETALPVDRSDVTEEIVRLKGHLKQFEKFIQTGGAESIGRKLDFLSQEMLRELNTLGAKALGIRIPHQVIDMKSEMEKIREQVQNIE